MPPRYTIESCRMERKSQIGFQTHRWSSICLQCLKTRSTSSLIPSKLKTNGLNSSELGNSVWLSIPSEPSKTNTHHLWKNSSVTKNKHLQISNWSRHSISHAPTNSSQLSENESLFSRWSSTILLLESLNSRKEILLRRLRKHLSISWRWTRKIRKH